LVCQENALSIKSSVVKNTTNTLQVKYFIYD
jgi:hypothetical protein